MSSSKPKLQIPKCICQICTCGRHRCPHNRGSIASQPVQTNSKCQVTEYQTAFEKWPFQPVRESLRPAIKPPMDDIPMDMKTIYEQTYKQHEPNVDIRTVKCMYKPPTAKMNLTSTYTMEFTPKDGKRRTSYQPERIYESSPTPFSNSTMYKENYKDIDPDNWENCRSVPIRHKECIEKSKDKLEGSTVMKNDFVKHENPERVGLIRPQINEVRSKARFDGNTTYKTEFTEKAYDRISPVIRSDHRPNTSPFCGETTAHADYVGWSDHKREPSFKPQLVYRPCEVKFDDRTTVSEAFRHWPSKKQEKPKWAHLHQYKTPTMPVQDFSSYQEDYIEPTGCQRAVPVKPKQNEMYIDRDINGNKINVTTQYQDMFKGYTGEDKPQSFKKVHVYEEPQDPFLAESCYQSYYKGEQCERAKKCGPKKNNLPSETRSKMRTATTYHEEYKGRSKADCPAKELAKEKEDTKRQISSASYSFKTVKHGHHYYAQEAQSKSKNSAKKTSGSNSTVKFREVATEIGSENGNVKVKEESEAKKIARVPTPPLQSSSKSTCKPNTVQATKKNVAICTC